MVTKQQQLEWLAKNWSYWPGYCHNGVACMKVDCIGELVNFSFEDRHTITKQEWQQERDKMQQKAETTVGDEVYSVLQERAEADNSWHERGELPPVGCECEAEYMDEWIHVTIIGIDSSGYRVFEVPNNVGDAPPYDGLRCPSAFRPLRTEREMAIEDLYSIIRDKTDYESSMADVIKAIVDAGYRKVKP